MRRVYRRCDICHVGFYEKDPECWFTVPYARMDGQTGTTGMIFCHKCQCELRRILGEEDD